MRRLAVILAGLAASAALAIAVIGPATSTGSSGYRVDVIFDNARGVIAGQLAKIAGAKVGTIVDVKVTPDYKARIQLRVDQRFAPFRSDATCTIRPEGLIAENYVECDPGTTAGRPLVRHGGFPPTVPVTRTSQPVNLNDLFNIWNTPTRDRLAVLVSQIGMGLIGRGGDFNTVLRRANPALALARKAISILLRQRTQLTSSIDATDRILAELGPKNRRVADFVTHAAAVASQTGRRHRELADAIHRLPKLLDVTRPALAKLDAFAVSGTPLLKQIRAASPDLSRLSADIIPFSAAARPTLVRLGKTFRAATGTLKRAQPVTKLLQSYAHQSLPDAQIAGKLYPNLLQTGFVANLLRFFYNAAGTSARYDSISHILPAHVSITSCSAFATSPVAGCSANYSTAAAKREGKRREPASQAPAKRPAGVPELKLPKQVLPESLKLPQLDLPKVPDIKVPDLPVHLPKIGPLRSLLDYLFG